MRRRDIVFMFVGVFISDEMSKYLLKPGMTEVSNLYNKTCCMRRTSMKVLFNNALNTFYLRLCGVGHINQLQETVCMNVINTNIRNTHKHTHARTYVCRYTHTNFINRSQMAVGSKSN